MSLGISVPSLQPETLNVIDVPLTAEGLKVQLVAVPAFSKSLLAIPETDSVKVIE